MPIYEYACTDCAHALEVLQKINEPALVQCPACGQNSLKKLISASAFHLKGTGWYETDFSGKKKKTEETKKTNKTTETPAPKTSSTPATTKTSDN